MLLYERKEMTEKTLDKLIEVESVDLLLLVHKLEYIEITFQVLSTLSVIPLRRIEKLLASGTLLFVENFQTVPGNSFKQFLSHLVG